MNAKITTSESITQQLPAGVSPDDHNIELVGQLDTKTVIWLQLGNAHTFDTLPIDIYQSLKEMFLSDEQAVKTIPECYPEAEHDLRRMVEIYTFHIYGGCDSKPDIIDGVLQQSENFRETTDCFSLKFKHKSINIGEVVLTDRDLQIIDDISNNLPDKMIAHNQGISIRTLDFHKRNLFKKIGATSKVDTLRIAFQNQVVC